METHQTNICNPPILFSKTSRLRHLQTADQLYLSMRSFRNWVALDSRHAVSCNTRLQPEAAQGPFQYLALTAPRTRRSFANGSRCARLELRRTRCGFRGQNPKKPTVKSHRPRLSDASRNRHLSVPVPVVKTQPKPCNPTSDARPRARTNRVRRR